MKELIENMSKGSHLPFEIINILITLIVGIIVIQIIVRVVRRMLDKSALDESSYMVILRTVRIICWILLGLTLITSAGINPSPYIAVLASVGAALRASPVRV